MQSKNIKQAMQYLSHRAIESAETVFVNFIQLPIYDSNIPPQYRKNCWLKKFFNATLNLGVSCDICIRVVGVIAFQMVHQAFKHFTCSFFHTVPSASSCTVFRHKPEIHLDV
jgi:hypothetical protein